MQGIVRVRLYILTVLVEIIGLVKVWRIIEISSEYLVVNTYFAFLRTMEMG